VAAEGPVEAVELEAAVERFMRTQRLDGSFEVGGVKYRDARQAEADSPEAAVAWYRSEGGPRRS